MKLHIVHTTRYRYSRPATDSQNEVRLMPLTDDDQVCSRCDIAVRPASLLFQYDLPWGRVHHFNVRAAHCELEIRMEAQVQTLRENPFDGIDLMAPTTDFYGPALRAATCEWILPTPRVPYDAPEVAAELDALAGRAREAMQGASPSAFLLALTERVHEEFPYNTDSTHVDTTLAEILSHHRSGVCQDFAHVMLAVCRRQGIPARYVSGYLFTGRGLHSGDVMHAWVECLVPDAQGRPVWRGFDPTNNLMAGKSFVKAHFGRDYGDVAPTRGVYQGGGASELEVDVRITEVGAG